MRPVVVLVILGLMLTATTLMKRERDGNFDARFNRAEERIRMLAEDIENDLNEVSESR